jgi:5-methylcytosine-specific restriction enzyme A
MSLRRPCLACPRAMAVRDGSYCARCEAERNARKNARRRHAPGSGAAAALRRAINAAGSGQCAGCGRTFVASAVEVDHLHPLWGRGERDVPRNVQPLSRPCHRRKTAEEARRRAIVAR